MNADDNDTESDKDDVNYDDNDEDHVDDNKVDDYDTDNSKEDPIVMLWMRLHNISAQRR